MNILKNFMCQTDTWTVVSYVVDVILIIIGIVWLATYFVKSSKKHKENVQLNEDEQNILQNNVEKINDDTYVINTEPVYEDPMESRPVQTPIVKDNMVEHFTKQLTDLNEDSSNETKSNAVVETHSVEKHIEKKPKKEEINNFVEIDGVKNQKSKTKIPSNRGVKGYTSTENLIKTLKEETAINEKPGKQKKTKK